MDGTNKKSKMIKTKYSDSEKFKKVIFNLNSKYGLPSNFSIRALQGGRNNIVFCVNYQDGTKALLKLYFKHPMDKRDRLKTEYSFLSFACNKKIRCIPRPIAADFQNNLGLYEFIEGRELSSSEVNENRIKQALDFYLKINKYKNTKEAKKLPSASEACFSVKDHIDCVNTRVEKLKKINEAPEANRKVIVFIKNELLPEWKKTIEHVNKSIDKFDIDSDENISNDETCISPSDFGYHNVLLNKSNKLIFIDFEYSGWDDPAKMVCDFFCQPEVQVPFKYFDLFVKMVAKNAANPKRLKHRILTLLPLYKIKWCCILLNEFLEIGFERRNFAYGKADLNKQKIAQLEKVRKYLESNKLNLY